MSGADVPLPGGGSVNDKLFDFCRRLPKVV